MHVFHEPDVGHPQVPVVEAAVKSISMEKLEPLLDFFLEGYTTNRRELCFPGKKELLDEQSPVTVQTSGSTPKHQHMEASAKSELPLYLGAPIKLG